MCDAVNLSYLERHFATLHGIRRVLEVGSYNVNGNCKSFITARGLDYLGLDVRPGPDVDLVCDITAGRDAVVGAVPGVPYDLVLCLNVLEHLFEPVRALDNMLAVLRPGGYLLIVTPAVWDLHDWPHDFFRLNPDFFRLLAEARNVRVVPGTFTFSARDTGRFYDDVDVLPMITPHMHGSVLARGAARVLGTFMSEFRECWTRLYLNLIWQTT
jgi:SAM-dependent methyltransferase